MIIRCASGYGACACVCGILEADLARCAVAAVGVAEINISKRLGCVGWPNPFACVAVSCLCLCVTAVNFASFLVSCVFTVGA